MARPPEPIIRTFFTSTCCDGRGATAANERLRAPAADSTGAAANRRRPCRSKAGARPAILANMAGTGEGKELVEREKKKWARSSRILKNPRESCLSKILVGRRVCAFGKGNVYWETKEGPSVRGLTRLNITGGMVIFTGDYKVRYRCRMRVGGQRIFLLRVPWARGR